MNVPAKFEVRSFTRSWDNSGYLKNFGQSLDTPFKVTQGRFFGANRKRVYDFILVRKSLVLSCTVSEIFQVFFALTSDPTPIPLQFWGSSRCTRWPMLRSARAEALSYSAVKLFSNNSNLCDHDTWTSHTDRQTDGQTDGRTTYDRNTELCTKVHRAIKIHIRGELFHTLITRSMKK